MALRGVILNISVTFFRQFFAGFLRIGVMLLVGRFLGPSGAGMYAIALLLPTLLGQILNLGINSANVYFIASRQYSVEQAWAVSRDLSVMMSVFGIAIGSLMTVAVGNRIFPNVPPYYILVCLGILPCFLLLGAIGGIYQATENFRMYNIVVLIEPVLTMLTVIALYFCGKIGLFAILLGTVAAHFIACMTGLALLSRSMTLLSRAHGSLRYVRAAIGYGIVAHLSNVATFLNYRLDLLLVNILAGPHASGLYSISVRLAEQIWIISQAVSTVIFPRLSAMNNDEDGRRYLTQVIARATLWITLAVSGVMAVFGEWAVGVAFGMSFEGSGKILLILLPGAALFACSRVLANDIAARGKVRINLCFAVAALALNTAGNVIFIPIYGAVGAAAVTSVVYSLDLIVRLVIQSRMTSTRWQTIVIPQSSDFDLIRMFITRKT